MFLYLQGTWIFEATDFSKLFHFLYFFPLQKHMLRWIIKRQIIFLITFCSITIVLRHSFLLIGRRGNKTSNILPIQVRKHRNTYIQLKYSTHKDTSTRDSTSLQGTSAHTEGLGSSPFKPSLTSLFFQSVFISWSDVLVSTWFVFSNMRYASFCQHLNSFIRRLK